MIWVEQQIAKIRAKRDVFVYRGSPTKGPDGSVQFNDPDWEKEWYIVGTVNNNNNNNNNNDNNNNNNNNIFI